MHRHQYIENGEMFVGFSNRRSLKAILQSILWPRRRRPMWQVRDLDGNVMHAPRGLTICSPNNWLRRICYAVNAPRWMRRKV